MKPQLFWLSVSHIDDEQRFLTGYRQFYEVAQVTAAVVVGGRALAEPIRREMQYTAYCDNLQHLDALVRTLSRSIAPGEAQLRDRGPRVKKSREARR